ncbi:ArsR/SmtB family transcription factor [Nocardioides hungaricus]
MRADTNVAGTNVVAPPPDEQVDLAVEVFRMLADATRIKLLHQLLHEERSVNELADAVGKAQAGVSQHLAKLRMARLVQSRRQGNQVFYRIESDHIRQLVEDALHNAEHASGGVPAHHRGSSDQGAVVPLAGGRDR